MSKLYSLLLNSETPKFAVNPREYHAICDAKNSIAEICHDTNWIDTPENACQLIRFILSRKNRNTFTMLQKQAFITVLVSGTFNNDGGFLMPTTSDCCINFSHVKKDLAKKRAIRLYVYDSVLEEEYPISVF